MRALRIIAIIFVALLMVMLLMLGYLFFSADVTVEVLGSQSVSAAAIPGFTDLKTSIDENTFIGTVYQKPAQWKDASDYAFVRYSLKMKNGCLVPLDMIEVQVVPLPTDVVQLGQLDPVSLRSKSEGELSATILAAQGGNLAREMIVTYYVWGVSFQIRTIGGQ